MDPSILNHAIINKEKIEKSKGNMIPRDGRSVPKKKTPKRTKTKNHWEQHKRTKKTDSHYGYFPMYQSKRKMLVEAIYPIPPHSPTLWALITPALILRRYFQKWTSGLSDISACRTLFGDNDMSYYMKLGAYQKHQ